MDIPLFQSRPNYDRLCSIQCNCRSKAKYTEYKRFIAKYSHEMVSWRYIFVGAGSAPHKLVIDVNVERPVPDLGPDPDGFHR